MGASVRLVSEIMFPGSGTEEDPYLISSEAAWNYLADQVSAGNTYSGKYFRQTEDISVSTMVGATSSHKFSGTYDGDGHTLTVNYNSTAQYAAPFSYADGATFKNLHIAGSITSSAKYVASFVGYSYGSNTFLNCRSSVAITSSITGDGTHGGFVGILEGDNVSDYTVTFEGCVFNGKLLGSNTTNCGGFVGWSQTHRKIRINLSNCLYAPQEVTISISGCQTFSRGQVLSDIFSTNTNNYYIESLGGTQGKQACSISAGDDVTINNLGDGTEYNVSGITAYAHGIKYGGTFYAGNGDEVSLNLSHDDKSGYTFNRYTASSGSLANPTSNSPTLTMPDANVTINAEWTPYVASITSGETVTNYTVFSDAVSNWVNNSTLKLLADVSLDSRIEINNIRTVDLNGYGIRMTGSDCFFRVLSGGDLTMIDSRPTGSTHKFNVSSYMAVLADEGAHSFQGGYLYGAPGYYSENGYRRGGAVHIEDNGKFTMLGGTIIGNHACFGGGVAAHSGTFVMEGGAIIYNKATDCSYHGGGGIWVEGGPGGKLTLGGTALVEHNYTSGYSGSQVFVAGGNAAIDAMTISGGSPRVINSASTSNVCPSNRIAITGELTTGANLSFLLDPGVFTTGYSTYNNVHPSTYFSSENAGYIIKLTTTGEVSMATPASLTVAPTAITGLVYSGAAQALVNAGTASGGTMMYSTDNSTWSASIPTATAAGEYTVYYMVEGDDNHTDYIPSPNTVAITINPGSVELTDGNGVTALSPFAGKQCEVTYSRSFTKDKASTVCMPFAYTKKEGDGSFYAFTGIEKKNGKYEATMTEPGTTTLTANTPYLYMPSATGDVDFSGTYTIPADLTAGSTTSGDWTFLGTYETVSWTEAPTGIYGFSAQNVSEQGISQGEFVKVGEYVRIKPMRAYLEYSGSTALAKANGMSATAAASNETLPETISVRLISAEGVVTAIGTINTKTGEVTTDGWYTLDGKPLPGKPTKPGIYVNNGNKVVIK